MGWTGTVDQFKALTPAQQNVWAHEHAAATKDTVPVTHGWAAQYGGFYKDPNTGVIDFTKWWDGSASGYDANMNPVGTGPTMNPSTAAGNKYKAESQADMNKALQQTVAGNPQFAQMAGQVGQQVPSTPAQPVIKPPVVAPPPTQPPPIGQPPALGVPPIATAPGFPDNGEVRIMPAPGRPMPSPSPTATTGMPPSEVRIRNASRIR
jgi:hypothetical protein